MLLIELDGPIFTPYSISLKSTLVEHPLSDECAESWLFRIGKDRCDDKDLRYRYAGLSVNSVKYVTPVIFCRPKRKETIRLNCVCYLRILP
jgi:hypothetical protein